MKFNYQARNKKGEISSGVVEASSKTAAIVLLQKQGLYVTILEETERLPIYARRIKIFERISKKDIVLFSRQLSIMFKSKVPLVETLQILATQTQNPDLKEKIFKLSEEVEGGTSLSGALNKYPKIFSSFYVSMIKAGEASGTLSESLEYLAKHLEREYRLTSKIRGAMIYPALILSFALIVLLLMIFFVIPQLAEVLKESGQELPAITKIVMDSSDFFKKWSWIFLGLGIALIVFVLRYYRTRKGKRFFDGLFLGTPAIGPFLKMVYISRFAENLSTLISGGLPIAQALEITGNIVDNSIYKEIIFTTRDRVRKGEPISSTLAQAPNLFPPMFCQMTLVGEKTGTLDKTLMDVVSFYQEETDRAIDALLSVLEPLLIMFLGLIVGGLMFAILMPLYQMVSF